MSRALLTAFAIFATACQGRAGAVAGDASDASAADAATGCSLPETVTAVLVDGAVACATTGPVWGITDGHAATAQPQADGTVLDTRTQLRWQPQPLAGLATQASARAACVNSPLAGRRDWRLPTVAEATTAVDFTAHDPALGLPLQATPGQALWTLETRADGGWTVDVATGAVRATPLTTPATALCVASGPLLPTLPTPRFLKDALGVVTDTWTGLVWDGNLPAQQRPLIDAFGWCAKLEFAFPGHPWRLPTVNELASLIDRSHAPAIDYDAFDMGGVAVHTSSATAADGSTHWVVDFTTGEIVAVEPDAKVFVRCIRGN